MSSLSKEQGWKFNLDSTCCLKSILQSSRNNISLKKLFPTKFLILDLRRYFLATLIYLRIETTVLLQIIFNTE